MNFGNPTRPVARKTYRCEWCFFPIAQGEKHFHFTGMFDGEWQNWRMHSECEDAYAQTDVYDGFTPGEGEAPARLRVVNV